MIVLPKTAGITCTLPLGNKVLHKLIINKYNNYKKVYQKDQQTIKPFDILYRKASQDTDKNKYESS